MTTSERPTVLQIQLSDPITDLIESINFRLDLDLTDEQWETMHEAVEQAITRTLPEIPHE